MIDELDAAIDAYERRFAFALFFAQPEGTGRGDATGHDLYDDDDAEGYGGGAGAASCDVNGDSGGDGVLNHRFAGSDGRGSGLSSGGGDRAGGVFGRGRGGAHYAGEPDGGSDGAEL